MRHQEDAAQGAFAPTALPKCGTRASVDQNPSRLIKAGTIDRVTRDVFAHPESSRLTGKVMNEPPEVVETTAKTTGAIAQVHGAEAARRLELATKIPPQSYS